MVERKLRLRQVYGWKYLWGFEELYVRREKRERGGGMKGGSV